MPRPTSAQSEPEEVGDSLLQEEYERVQHQLRVLQNERQRQTNETNAKLGRYNHEVEQLEKENTELKTLLALTNSDQNRKKDTKTIEELKHQLAQQDELYEQIEETKRYNQRLDAETRKYEKMIREKQQERCIQVKYEKEAGEMKSELEKKILTMERNLHMKTSKFCNDLAENEKLRADIEKLRNERHICVSLQKRFEEKLAQINKLKSKITQHATAAYDQRADAIARRVALQEKNGKDQAAIEAEMRDLQRTIDHNSQLQHFMTIKANERSEWKREAEERRKKHGSTGEIAREQQRLKIEQYDRAMSRIVEIVGKDDVESITRVYRRNEDDNFTLFQYVTELNNQIEDLHENIEQLNKEMAIYSEQQAEKEKCTHAVMHELELQMNADKQIGDADELRVAQIHKVLDQVKSQVKQLAIKLGCDVNKIVEMMGGDGEEVTERNLMLYLSALEQRVDELLAIKCYSLSKGYGDGDKHDDLKNGMTLGLIEIPSVQNDFNASLPSLNDEEHDDQESNTPHTSVRPLTQAELISRVTRELQKQSVSNVDQLTQRSSSRTGLDNRRPKKGRVEVD
ncbi:Outer dynein arm protein 1 [Paragonimus skrjabini miyazakii]|uniref:Outer dynein arm protein 1 n=1 Tax=Paragonimus skrjabini miyazakii TaxID=59628 RepID=A0A8S9YI30_9TREM|nr:Outer dynein arm protein 1 [Paragonimus skrjabini miyazakii]